MIEEFVSKRQQMARRKKEISINSFQNARPDKIGEIIDSKPKLRDAVEDLSQLVVVLEERVAYLEELLDKRS